MIVNIKQITAVWDPYTNELKILGVSEVGNVFKYLGDRWGWKKLNMKKYIDEDATMNEED